MTFFKVNDPKNRELIKEVIAKRSIIREADRRRKMGEAFEFEQLSQFFKPITKEAEKIEKGVRGLPGEIAKILPQPINITRNITQQMQPPPAYEPPFAGEAELPTVEEEERDLPPYITKYKGIYNIGEFPFDINHETKEIKDLQGEKILTDSPNIYEILTNKNTTINWDDLNEREKYVLGSIIVQSKSIYSNYNIKPKENSKLKNKQKQWRNLYSYIWFNRFSYMGDGDKMFEKEKTQAEKYLKHKDKRITQQTKEVIRQRLSKGKGLKGSGLKKNYVTLPSDPSELVDRLTLLSGSKDAGNTGVYNEMVSICDELLKRKIIGKGQYKQFLSNI